jgi:hypothetical protein
MANQEFRWVGSQSDILIQLNRSSLPLLGSLGGLKSFASAPGEVAGLRQLRLFVHWPVHPHMNAFCVPASALLNPRVVHLWFASPSFFCDSALALSARANWLTALLNFAGGGCLGRLALPSCGVYFTVSLSFL